MVKELILIHRISLLAVRLLSPTRTVSTLPRLIPVCQLVFVSFVVGIRRVASPWRKRQTEVATFQDE